MLKFRTKVFLVIYLVVISLLVFALPTYKVRAACRVHDFTNGDFETAINPSDSIPDHVAYYWRDNVNGSSGGDIVRWGSGGFHYVHFNHNRYAYSYMYQYPFRGPGSGEFGTTCIYRVTLYTRKQGGGYGQWKSKMNSSASSNIPVEKRHYDAFISGTNTSSWKPKTFYIHGPRIEVNVEPQNVFKDVDYDEMSVALVGEATLHDPIASTSCETDSNNSLKDKNCSFEKYIGMRDELASAGYNNWYDDFKYWYEHLWMADHANTLSTEIYKCSPAPSGGNSALCIKNAGGAGDSVILHPNVGTGAYTYKFMARRVSGSGSCYVKINYGNGTITDSFANTSWEAKYYPFGDASSNKQDISFSSDSGTVCAFDEVFLLSGTVTPSPSPTSACNNPNLRNVSFEQHSWNNFSYWSESGEVEAVTGGAADLSTYARLNRHNWGTTRLTQTYTNSNYRRVYNVSFNVKKFTTNAKTWRLVFTRWGGTVYGRVNLTNWETKSIYLHGPSIQFISYRSSGYSDVAYDCINATYKGMASVHSDTDAQSCSRYSWNLIRNRNCSFDNYIKLTDVAPNWYDNFSYWYEYVYLGSNNSLPSRRYYACPGTVGNAACVTVGPLTQWIDAGNGRFTYILKAKKVSGPGACRVRIHDGHGIVVDDNFSDTDWTVKAYTFGNASSTKQYLYLMTTDGSTTCAYDQVFLVRGAPPAPDYVGASISDKNKQSLTISLNDGRDATKLVENTPFSIIGGIGDDPYKYLAPGPAGIVSPDPQQLFNGVNYQYVYSDHNPFEINVTLRDRILEARGIDSYSLGFRDVYDNSYLLNIDSNYTYTGVEENTLNVKNYTSLSACMNDNTTIMCAKNESEVDNTDPSLLDIKVLYYFKNGVRNTDYALMVSATNVLGATRSVPVDLRTLGLSTRYLKIDTVAPAVAISQKNVSGSRVTMQVQVTDNNMTGSIPLFRTYAVGINNEKGNHFLFTRNNISLNGLDFENNPFGARGYQETVSGNVHTYTIDLDGVKGGDTLYFGVCAYDAAGNVTCKTSDAIQVGWNWLKTSLGNVYSKQGFSGLPNYDPIHNVSEEPVSTSVSPFNASDATIGTFLVSHNVNNSNNIKVGYDGHYNDTYRLNSRFIKINSGWFDYLKLRAIKKCNLDVNSCSNSVLSQGTATQLPNLTLSSANAQKIITLRNLNLNIDSLTCTKQNLIFLQNAHLTVKEILKPTKSITTKTDDVCLFVADSNSSITIDDDKDSGWLQDSTLANYSYKRTLTIHNDSRNGVLTDYQVLLQLNTRSLIASGKMQSDCDDIRITDSDGVTLLPYWIESGCNSSPHTRIWVKVPSIPVGSTKKLYLYYGNGSATKYSNATNTLEFYEDFNGESIVSLESQGWRKWYSTDLNHASAPRYRIESNRLSIYNPYGWGYHAFFAYPNISLDNFVLEVDTRTVQGYHYHPGPRIRFRAHGNTSVIGAAAFQAYATVNVGSVFNTKNIFVNWNNSTRRFPTTWLHQKITAWNNEFRWYINNSLIATSTSSSNPFGWFVLGQYEAYTFFDNLRIRKYTKYPVTVSIGSETASGGVNGSSNVDLVQAGFIMLGNSTFYVKQTPASAYTDSDGIRDRLIIHGFVFTDARPPRFDRDLGFDNNESQPAEWIIYDPALTQYFKSLLSATKIATLNCGVNPHPFCGDR